MIPSQTRTAAAASILIAPYHTGGPAASQDARARLTAARVASSIGRDARGPLMSIGHTIRRLRREVPGWRVTALAEVAAQWHDPFRVLVACLLSLRTKDQTTGPAAARLFALADTPEGIRRLTPRAIERAIYPVGFYRTKARVLRGSAAICSRASAARCPTTSTRCSRSKGWAARPPTWW